MEESAFREGDGVPGVFAGEVVPIERDDEEVVELVPDGTTEGFHERRDGGEGEREYGFEQPPEGVLLVDDLVEKGFEADELQDIELTLNIEYGRGKLTSE